MSIARLSAKATGRAGIQMRFWVLLHLILILAPALCAADTNHLNGRVEDDSGEPVHEARVEVLSAGAFDFFGAIIRT